MGSLRMHSINQILIAYVAEKTEIIDVKIINNNGVLTTGAPYNYLI